MLESIAIADAALDIEGWTLDDLFQTAAAALADVQVDPASVARTASATVTLSAPSIDLLLFDWLGELIFRKDRDRMVFPDTHVEIAHETEWTLVARLTGGPLDAARVTLRADVKAVTFHQFVVERLADRWHARVILDI